MTPVRVSTCIVGGGPAGLMLGLLLAKRGAGVLVLEGHETFDREFRGEVLQPSTAHLLDELGLLEYVKAQPHSLLEAGRVRLNGREIGEFSFKRIAPWTGRSSAVTSSATGAKLPRRWNGSDSPDSINGASVLTMAPTSNAGTGFSERWSR